MAIAMVRRTTRTARRSSTSGFGSCIGLERPAGGNLPPRRAAARTAAGA